MWLCYCIAGCRFWLCGQSSCMHSAGYTYVLGKSSPPLSLDDVVSYKWDHRFWMHRGVPSNRSKQVIESKKEVMSLFLWSLHKCCEKIAINDNLHDLYKNALWLGRFGYSSFWVQIYLWYTKRNMIWRYRKSETVMCPFTPQMIESLSFFGLLEGSGWFIK